MVVNPNPNLLAAATSIVVHRRGGRRPQWSTYLHTDPKIVEMQMNIDCDGCEDNVRKALIKLSGVHYVEVDRVRNKVTVTGSVSQKKVLRAARGTGRLAVLWPSPYNPEYAYAQPAYYQAKPHAAAAHAQHYYHHYNSVQHSKNGGGGDGGSLVAYRPAAQYQPMASSYNYHVHGYYDSDLHGYYHEHALSNIVPVAARSYFSDDNPNACSIM